MKTVNQIPTTTAVTTPNVGTSFDLGDGGDFSVQVIFTGVNVVGTLTLEASDDNTNFVTVTNSSQAVTASTGHMWNVTGAGYRYVRPRWVYTSGAGNITANLYFKDARGC